MDRRTVTVEILVHPDFLNKDEPQNEPKSTKKIKSVSRLLNW